MADAADHKSWRFRQCALFLNCCQDRKSDKCALISVCFLVSVAVTFFGRCSDVVNSMIGLSFARFIRPCLVTRLGSGWARLRNLEAVRIPTWKRLIELATYCHNFVACVMG